MIVRAAIVGLLILGILLILLRALLILRILRILLLVLRVLLLIRIVPLRRLLILLWAGSVTLLRRILILSGTVGVGNPIAVLVIGARRARLRRGCVGVTGGVTIPRRVNVTGIVSVSIRSAKTQVDAAAIAAPPVVARSNVAASVGAATR